MYIYIVNALLRLFILVSIYLIHRKRIKKSIVPCIFWRKSNENLATWNQFVLLFISHNKVSYTIRGPKLTDFNVETPLLCLQKCTRNTDWLRSKYKFIGKTFFVYALASTPHYAQPLCMRWFRHLIVSSTHLCACVGFETSSFRPPTSVHALVSTPQYFASPPSSAFSLSVFSPSLEIARGGIFPIWL